MNHQVILDNWKLRKLTPLIEPFVYRSWVKAGAHIHDHFNGSENCVQCGGDCELDGESLLLTELIRWMFERWALGYRGPDKMQKMSLDKYGVRIEECYDRACSASRDLKGILEWNKYA